MSDYRDPAKLTIEDTTPRRAKLRVQPTIDSDEVYVSFEASNGEPLGIGETHDNQRLGEQSREAWLRAMVQVLEDEGYVVIEPPVTHG